MRNRLWVEKWRPNTASEYVFVDTRQKTQVLGWIKDGSIPHLLMSGDPGTGKTTLAKVLIHDLGIEDYDIMEINASRENGVEIVRQKINAFAQTMPFGKFKVILLDEADYTSPEFQAALRHDMEAYHLTVRFILTCNYASKIIPALKSRCHEMHIAKTDLVDFTTRAAQILVNENIEFDLDVLDTYVRVTYPDLRKCLNTLQSNSGSGTLIPPVATGSDENELLMEATTLFKSKNYIDGRKQLMQYLSLYPTRVEDVFVWCYRNVDLWGTTTEKKDQAIIVIRNGLASLPLVGIPEIALAASLSELCSI